MRNSEVGSGTGELVVAFAVKLAVPLPSTSAKAN